MKKFISMGCTSTPSVKGIYTALFILVLSVPMFAQVEPKANSNNSNYDYAPSPKWEISVDLKPLFRKEEPYNVGVKWHFTEKKAIRLRIGSANSSSSLDSVRLLNQDFTHAGLGGLGYSEGYPKRDKKINGQLSIGYQYSFTSGRIGFYTATEFNYEQVQEDYNTFGGAKGYVNINLYDSLKSNIYYNKTILSYLKYRTRTFGISQMVGVDYKFNNHLSISSEFAISYYNTYHYLSKTEDLPSNSSAVFQTYSEFTSSGANTGFMFKPLLGLYLNYHF